MIIKKLSKDRFEAFIAYTRHPISLIFVEELEYWSDENERVIGLISLDKTDGDFSLIILGRDEAGRFRAVDIEVDIENLNAARTQLFELIESWTRKPDKAFYQHDATAPVLKLFETLPELKEGDLNTSFKLLQNNKGFSAAKEIIAEIMPHYADIDGNQFVKQFQTEGFDQRLWELYLFCFLNENRFKRDVTHNRPDFYAELFRDYIGVEALTVGKVKNEKSVPDILDTEAFREYMRLRFSNALRKKLKHKHPYWEEQHMKNVPFILAVADFHFEAKILSNGESVRPPSLLLSRPALEEYLYGGKFEMTIGKNGEIGNKLIPFNHQEKYLLPFFSLPGAENVSAVLFSNLGTIAKFNRMGKIAGFGSKDVKIFQLGEVLNPDTAASTPLPFLREVEPEKHVEYWGDGINIYHNPNAKNPLDKELFPYSIHHFLENETLVSEGAMSSFHPFWSINNTIYS